MIYKFVHEIFMFRFIRIVGFFIRRINPFSYTPGKDTEILDSMYLIIEESILMVIYLLWQTIPLILNGVSVIHNVYVM